MRAAFADGCCRTASDVTTRAVDPGSEFTAGNSSSCKAPEGRGPNRNASRFSRRRRRREAGARVPVPKFTASGKTLVIARRPKGAEAIQREFRTKHSAPAYAGVRCARNDGVSGRDEDPNRSASRFSRRGRGREAGARVPVPKFTASGKTLVIARRPKGAEAIQREFRTRHAAPAYAGVRCARNDGVSGRDEHTRRNASYEAFHAASPGLCA